MYLFNITNLFNYGNIVVNVYKIIKEYFGLIIEGLGMTLLLSLLTVVFGAILGLIICLLTMSKNKILKIIGSAYVEIIRGVPLLLNKFLSLI